MPLVLTDAVFINHSLLRWWFSASGNKGCGLFTVDDAGGVPPPHLLAPLVAKALGDGRDLTEIGLMRGLRKC